MATNCKVHVNVTSNCGAGQDRATVPGNYVEMDLANDRLIFSAGSSAVADNEDTPTDAELNEAATLITTSEVEIAHTFLLDASNTGHELQEIFGANSGDNRYVFCLEFDGATATEPTLEAWNTSSHTAATIHSLGNGTPANSMIKAILTTDETPGANWAGTPIAGANKLNLNGGAGALSGAKDIYFNLHVDIPAEYPEPFTENPVVTVRFTWS